MFADRLRLAGGQGKLDGYTKVLLHMDGVCDSTLFIDETEKIWTAYGNAKIGTPEKYAPPLKFGTAYGIFNADPSYISTPYTEDFNFGNDVFTIVYRVVS